MQTVSIIIPVYNTEEYVRECIQSVLQQTYKKIEIIIVDDNSTDDSRQIINELEKQNSQIKSFYLKERKGVGAARNLGLKHASGDFVYFLDSDDYLPAETIKYLVSCIGNNNMIRGRMKTTDLASSMTVVFSGLFNPKMFERNRYNLIKNNSATNFLFTKQFIQKNNLTFSEDVEVYSDLYFMIPALIATKQVPYLNEAIYFRRRRDDPVSNLAISQYDESKKINDFFHAYKELKYKYNDLLANEFLDRHLLNFYRRDIVSFFEDNDENVGKFYYQLYDAINQVDSDILAEYDWFFKREIKTILNNNKEKYKRVNARHHLLRDIKAGIKSKRKFLIFLYKRFFTKLPIKENLIFFESFLGKNYSDSPKYIYEHLLEGNSDYKFVWSFNENTSIPGTAKQVKRASIRYFYNLARAKYWVSNARMPNDVKKRKESIYLQTWHGTPLKKLAGDLDNVLMPGTNLTTYKRNFCNETAKWDYLISPNSYSTNIFKRAFWFKGKILEFGYPRNDILYKKNNKENIEKIKEKLNLPLNKKVILYAPTWRDDQYYSVGNYKFSLQLDLSAMQEQLGKDYIIILRMHYLIASQLDVSKYNNFVFNFSSYNDISELYLVSDILITDYSSVFFDYANLKRPILFYTYDLEKYRDQLRGFYLDIEKDVPGPLLMTTEEVIKSIKNIEEIKKDYKSLYEEFYNNFCMWDDGHASKRTVKAVFQNE